MQFIGIIAPVAFAFGSKVIVYVLYAYLARSFNVACEGTTEDVLYCFPSVVYHPVKCLYAGAPGVFDKTSPKVAP